MAIGGRGGSVKFSSSTGGTPALVADLSQWTLNVSQDSFEATVFGSSGWRTFQPNLTGAQGSISGFWNVVASTEMRALQAKLLAQDQVPAKIKLYINNTELNGYSAEVWISELQLGASVDALVPFGANFTCHGAVAFSTTL